MDFHQNGYIATYIATSQGPAYKKEMTQVHVNNRITKCDL